MNNNLIIQKIKEKHTKYNDSIESIATMYAINDFLSKGVINGNIQLGTITHKLSNNFTNGFTTIKTTQDIIDLINKGLMNRYNNYQTIVLLYSNLEVFIDELLEIFNLSPRTNDLQQIILETNLWGGGSIITQNSNIVPLRVKTTVILKMYYLLNYFGDKSGGLSITFDSHAVGHLYRIATIRNCIAHTSGFIDDENEIKLRKFKFGTINMPYIPSKGNYLEIQENQLDDHIHIFKLIIGRFISTLKDEINLI
ncbi:MAG: hypothetical protein PHR68_04160 [Candidatus Gracilibacteria bacterium]|nr:hypothetical protein [Candidatus Gracilibacteria bacterium]